MTDSTSSTASTGHKWIHNGRAIRASKTVVTLKGVEIDVEYVTEGERLAATDIDDRCTPTARVLGAQIGGVDCLQLLDRGELEQLIERAWS